MTTADATTIDPAELPATISDYLRAHVARDVETALAAFAEDAVVTDEGNTYRGTEEIRGWLRNGGAEFTYTTELIAAERVDAERWVATNHLEGDFPGGVADLNYRFTLRGDQIVALAIGA